MIIKVASIQCGANTLDKKKNINNLLKLIDEAGSNKPDFVLLSELCYAPFFFGAEDDSFFNWAETIPGQITDTFAEKAKQYHMYIIAPIFEKAENGNYYNSAVLLSPKGKIIKGTLDDGTEIPAYRKCHIPYSFDENGILRANEKYYSTPGPGIATFDTMKCRIGILICYDKRYLEAWRVLELMGAQIVFLPMATWGWKLGTLESELRTFACNCGYFIVSSSKAGEEFIEGQYKRNFVGSSLIVNPLGDIIAKGPTYEGPAIIYANLNMDLIGTSRALLPLARDRRPELYKLLTKI